MCCSPWGYTESDMTERLNLLADVLKNVLDSGAFTPD